MLVLCKSVCMCGGRKEDMEWVTVLKTKTKLWQVHVLSLNELLALPAPLHPGPDPCRID